MRHIRAASVIGAAFILGLSLLAGGQRSLAASDSPAAPAAPATKTPVAAPATTPADRAFARLKSLEGKWGTRSDKGWSNTTTFRTIASGSCVMETLEMGAKGAQTMVTMYHLHDGKLMLTHYCAAKNQPRMVASTISDDGRQVTFEFKDATGIPSRDVGHMDKAQYEFTGDAAFTSRWTWYQDGQERWMEKVEFVRIPADDSSPAPAAGAPKPATSAALNPSATSADKPAAEAKPANAASPGVLSMSSPIGYNGGLTCSIQVSNLDKAIKWYSEKLDFKLLYKVDEMGWAELATETKGVNIGLSQVEKITGTGNCKLTFGVADIDKTRKMLEGKGVKFTGETIVIEGMVKLATFEDQDKNVAMFYQDLQKH